MEMNVVCNIIIIKIQNIQTTTCIEFVVRNVKLGGIL
jgi:hypothetical protein